MASAIYALTLAIVLGFLGAVMMLASPSLDSAAMMRGRTPDGVIVLLFSFALLIFGVGITVKLLHKRAAWGVIGSLRATARDFRIVVPPIIALAVLLLPFSAQWDVSEPNLGLAGPDCWLTDVKRRAQTPPTSSASRARWVFTDEARGSSPAICAK